MEKIVANNSPLLLSNVMRIDAVTMACMRLLADVLAFRNRITGDNMDKEKELNKKYYEQAKQIVSTEDWFSKCRGIDCDECFMQVLNISETCNGGLDNHAKKYIDKHEKSIR